MFKAEPQVSWNAEEAAEFEQYAADQLKRTWISAGWAGAALILNTLCVIPFSKGHSFESYWHTARYLVILAMALFLWFTLRVAFVWSSWQTARETRREFGDLK
jgi:hypothetical protein